MRELRLGTIGSGEIVRNILDAVQRTGGIRLEAVYSRSEEKGRALAESYGAHKVYTDVEAFLSDGEIDFVYIASPNSLHYEYSRRALLAGKNVLCEKPFCPTLREALELKALAEQRGLYLIEAVPTSYLPNFTPLREALEKIGAVKLVMGNYSQYSSRYAQLLAGKLTNVFDPAFAGGCLMDINYYNVYLSLALFGKPEKAVYYPNMAGGVDSSGLMLMHYPGFVASLSGAKDANGVNFYQIEGDKGYIYVTEGSNGLKSLRIVTHSSDETVNFQPEPSRWYYEIRELTRLLLAGERQAVMARMELTLGCVAVVEQARKAAGIVFPGDK